ncbi:heavy metal-responsive transcriptional regulator [Marinobacterium nitratireducens]|uniref:Heavy metal-responsive transcriptional regulator n=1 Tax=Marinobacterium nitratireducens TaxID=518897 RepID=A0A917Z6P7_9GAMM|nr:MerR family transcriptional regulator [Marinobacterium nitratireducens]GGO76600.1 heavy metal-responsive transcriptional regulator [Marinobacterium nitratireducens]
MTVNQLAKKLKVAPDTVRYYTRIGLLAPRKSAENGYRQYSARDEERLRFALRARLLGFTLRDIQQILDHADSGDSPCPLVRSLIVRRVDEMREQLREAQALFERMESALEQWDRMPDKAPCGDMICHLIESWSPADEKAAELLRPMHGRGLEHHKVGTQS